jgi:predicted Zn-dependent peptidase
MVWSRLPLPLSRHLFLILLPLLLLPAPGSGQGWTVADQVQEATLDNGLTVLLVPRPESDRVRCVVAYRVGSINEAPGITGISHFLEHMMFKGTRERAHENAILDAYKAAGATGVNAVTGKEKTEFQATLPKENLEVCLDIEADRMENAVLRGFDAEREVVLEERQRAVNRPRVLFMEQLDAAFYSASPYGWPTLGWSSDLESITRQEMEGHRELYYRPDNATLILVGGLEVEAALDRVRAHFGSIPSRGPSPRVRTREPTQDYLRGLYGPDFAIPSIQRRVLGRAPGVPFVQLRFHVPPMGHQDTAPLTVLSVLFMMPTGELHRTLVEERQHAHRILAHLSNLMYDGAFTLQVNLREMDGQPVATPEEVEATLWTFVENAQREPFDPELLQAVKNQAEASVIRASRGLRLARTLADMETTYEWEYLDELQRRILAVTPQDLMRVARKYLRKENGLVAILRRER